MPHNNGTQWYPKGDPKQTEITSERLNALEQIFIDAINDARNLANGAKASTSIPSFIEVRDSDPTDPDLMQQYGRMWLLRTANVQAPPTNGGGL